jgi:cyclohexa-1,5-dienecarbonyl-CoA hydratase
MGIDRDDRGVGTLTVSTLTIDHGPAGVLDLEHVRELSGQLRQIRADDRSRIVVLRGAGKVFSTGVDIRQHTAETMPELLPAFHSLFEDLLGIPAVTIAAVHGRCLGGAAELAFACDRLIAETGTEIGLPEIQLGCYPPVAIPLLAARVGIGRATEMILGGKPTPLETLAGWGLVHGIAEARGLDAAIAQECARYSRSSPAVIGMVAELLHEEARRLWSSRIPAVEAAYLEVLLPHPDCSEGISAFVEKRAARWKGPEGLMGPGEVAL